MEQAEFVAPEDAQLVRWLGPERFKVWSRFRRRIEQLYALAPAWADGGKKWRCECKYRLGGKTLCALYAKEQTFGLMMICGCAERENVEAIREELTPFIQTCYDAATTYHDGKWVMFENPAVTEVEPLLRLLRIKRKPVGSAAPEIRLATAADISAVAALIADNFDHAMPEHSSAIREKFKTHCSSEILEKQLAWKQIFVVIGGGVVVGTGALVNFGTAECPKWSVSNFFIAVDQHDKGYGATLLKHLFAVMRKHRVAELHVPSSRTAIGFYRKFGFKTDAAQPPEDAADEITWMTVVLA